MVSNIVPLIGVTICLQHLALVTLVFPDSHSAKAASSPPLPDTIPIPANSSVQVLPSTSSSIFPISHDSTLAFSLPYSDAEYFLSTLHELPDGALRRGSGGVDAPGDARPSAQGRGWVMKAAVDMNGVEQRSFKQWARDAWSEFLDLIKVSDSATTYPVETGVLTLTSH